MRLDPSVDGLVLFQRVFQGEAVIAYLARVRLNPRVDLHVTGECSLLAETFLTNFALVGFLDPTRHVPLLVSPQAGHLLESRVARGAREWPVLAVAGVVAHQALHQGEAFVAHGAGVGSVPSVRQLVPFQSPFVSKALVARVARERLGTYVPLFVSLQGALLCECS